MNDIHSNKILTCLSKPLSQFNLITHETDIISFWNSIPGIDDKNIHLDWVELPVSF